MEQTRISPISTPRLNWRVDLPIAAALSLLTLALYWRVGHFGFINFDDPIYIDPPSRVSLGLTPGSIWWAFTTFYFNWHPLTWMSLMVDFSLFLGTPGAIHLHSAILHAINVLLLYVVLRYVTGQKWPSVIATTLFAMHPLRVEPVVWVSARKDVLSSMFWLLAMLFYSIYARKKELGEKTARYYLLTLAAMALGLMCKGMLVSLPLGLLVFDYWPLRRFDPGAMLKGDRAERRKFLRLLIEKAPLILLAIAGTCVTVAGQAAVGAIAEHLTLRDRLGNAAISYVKYLWMTVAPHGLSFFYPHPAVLPHAGISNVQIAGALALILLITFLVVIFARKWPWLAAGWVWYLIILLPVIGIIQIGAQAMADRYTYLPSIGLCMAAAWSIEALPLTARNIFRIAALMVVSVLMALTWLQIGRWRDSETLMNYAIRANPKNYVAYSNLAGVYEDRGETERALEEQRQVLQIKPDDSTALSYLATRAAAEKNTAEATRLFEQSVSCSFVPAASLNNYANFLESIGRDEEAIRVFRGALAMNPENPQICHNYALALARRGEINQAIPLWQKAIELKPDYTAAHFGLAQALLLARRDLQAIAEFKAALATAPDRVDIMSNLAWVLATDSVPEFRDGPQAVRLAQHACELSNNTDAIALDSLAAAQARIGQFQLAVQNAHLAADAAARQNLSDLAQQIARRISLYEKGEPYTSGD